MVAYVAEQFGIKIFECYNIWERDAELDGIYALFPTTLAELNSMSPERISQLRHSILI